MPMRTSQTPSWPRFAYGGVGLAAALTFVLLADLPLVVEGAVGTAVFLLGVARGDRAANRR